MEEVTTCRRRAARECRRARCVSLCIPTRVWLETRSGQRRRSGWRSLDSWRPAREGQCESVPGWCSSSWVRCSAEPGGSWRYWVYWRSSQVHGGIILVAAVAAELDGPRCSTDLARPRRGARRASNLLFFGQHEARPLARIGALGYLEVPTPLSPGVVLAQASYIHRYAPGPRRRRR